MTTGDQFGNPGTVQHHWPITCLFRRNGVIRRVLCSIGIGLITLRRLILACIVMIATVMPCFAQALDESTVAKNAREELCRRVLCRPAMTVRVLLKDGMVMEVPYEDVSPIVLPNGWVTILPGEEIHIAFDVGDGALSNPQAVQQLAGSQPSLSFRFDQDAETGDSKLRITSTLKYTVKYDLGMMLPDSDDIFSTSSCPVQAGLKSYEHWGFPVFQFIAARFRVPGPESEMTCE
jgi:hypothetical protein